MAIKEASQALVDTKVIPITQTAGNTKMCANVFDRAIFHLSVKISRHSLNQSETKTNRDTRIHFSFSRASCRPHVFSSSSDRFIGLPVPLMIGQSDCFGFGFAKLNRKSILRDPVAVSRGITK